jgi:hypothetical protein
MHLHLSARENLVQDYSQESIKIRLLLEENIVAHIKYATN